MSSVHYDGFISYRHNKRDTAVAIEIQHSLEHFHIPGVIREKYHKERFERIFRDEEELNTGADLAKKIEEALDNSEYLIIICSNEYTKSKWCLLEVETFLKKHDPDHVLCVLSEGEPPAIFPEALLEKGEPLACDYRMEFKEAKRSQLPKLASTMIGCTYDELVMRQEKYRRKRALILTSIIASLAIIAISYLLYSNARIRENYNNTLINESKILAKESLDFYDEKDRYNAILRALQALPSEDFDRPLTDEAQFALSRATYTYQMTRYCTEIGRIDSFNDISEFFISNDSRYLVCLDTGKNIRTYDLASDEQIIDFRFASADAANIHEGKSGEVIACSNEEVFSYDFLKGEKIWSMPLKHQTFSISHPSDDHKLIACSNADVIEILIDEGKLELELSLPEGYEGYIRDFAWSKDGKLIAVNTRDTVSDSYKVGIFDLENEAFTDFEKKMNGILYMEFCEDGTLFVLEDMRKDYSSLIRSVETNVVSNYILHAYKDSREAYELSFDSSSLFDEIKVLDKGDDHLFVFGNQVYLIDQKGNIVQTYSVRGTISKVFYSSDDNIHIACDNGYVGDLYFEDGHSVLIKNFPEAYDDIETTINNKAGGLNFYVLKDGDIKLFENTYDDSLITFEEAPFYLPPQEKIIDGELMMVKADNVICFADLKGITISSAIRMEENTYYHLLDLFEDKGFILKCESKKACLLLTVDAHDGNIIESRELLFKDFYENQGFFDFPLNINEAIFFDQFYAYPSAIVSYDHKLYYHDFFDLNTIHIYDLKSKEERTVKPDLGNMFLVNNNNSYFYPSELQIFDNGNKIYATAHDFSTDKPLSHRFALYIDLNDSSVHYLDKVPSAGFYSYGRDDILVYSDDNAVNIVDTDKNNLIEIPSPQKAISYFHYENRLYMVNPDSTLVIYEEGKPIRKIVLESNIDISMCPNKLVRFEVHDRELFVYIDTMLFIVNLDSDSERTLYDYQENVLGYIDDCFIVFGYDGRKNDSLIYLGEYKRYSLSELIERANRQLEEFE